MGSGDLIGILQTKPNTPTTRNSQLTTPALERIGYVMRIVKCLILMLCTAAFAQCAGAGTLSGVQVLSADTRQLPPAGQNTDAGLSAKSVLTEAGASVVMVRPGDLGSLKAAPGRVLVWESAGMQRY